MSLAESGGPWLSREGEVTAQKPLFLSSVGPFLEMLLIDGGYYVMRKVIAHAPEGPSDARLRPGASRQRAESDRKGPFFAPGSPEDGPWTLGILFSGPTGNRPVHGTIFSLEKTQWRLQS